MKVRILQYLIANLCVFGGLSIFLPPVVAGKILLAATLFFISTLFIMEVFK